MCQSAHVSRKCSRYRRTEEDLEFLLRFISTSLVKRSALRNSARPEIRQVWTDTSAKNIATDSLLCSSDGLSEAKKSLKSSLILKAESHIHSLLLQDQAIQVIVDCVPKSGIEQWTRVVEALPDFLFRFVKKALQQQLPTASNLARWKRIPDCIENSRELRIH